MALSFLLLWGWFVARQSALSSGTNIHIAWNAALLLSVIALVVVLVRRFKRTLEGLRAVHPAQRGRSDHN